MKNNIREEINKFNNLLKENSEKEIRQIVSKLDVMDDPDSGRVELTNTDEVIEELSKNTNISKKELGLLMASIVDVEENEEEGTGEIVGIDEFIKKVLDRLK
jgi:hypothetical protein